MLRQPGWSTIVGVALPDDTAQAGTASTNTALKAAAAAGAALALLTIFRKGQAAGAPPAEKSPRNTPGPDLPSGVATEASPQVQTLPQRGVSTEEASATTQRLLSDATSILDQLDTKLLRLLGPTWATTPLGARARDARDTLLSVSAAPSPIAALPLAEAALAAARATAASVGPAAEAVARQYVTKVSTARLTLWHLVGEVFGKSDSSLDVGSPQVWFQGHMARGPAVAMYDWTPKKDSIEYVYETEKESLRLLSPLPKSLRDNLSKVVRDLSKSLTAWRQKTERARQVGIKARVRDDAYREFIAALYARRARTLLERARWHVRWYGAGTEEGIAEAANDLATVRAARQAEYHKAWSAVHLAESVLRSVLGTKWKDQVEHSQIGPLVVGARVERFELGEADRLHFAAGDYEAIRKRYVGFAFALGLVTEARRRAATWVDPTPHLSAGKTERDLLAMPEVTSGVTCYYYVGLGRKWLVQCRTTDIPGMEPDREITNATRLDRLLGLDGTPSLPGAPLFTAKTVLLPISKTGPGSAPLTPPDGPPQTLRSLPVPWHLRPGDVASLGWIARYGDRVLYASDGGSVIAATNVAALGARGRRLPGHSHRADGLLLDGKISQAKTPIIVDTGAFLSHLDVKKELPNRYCTLYSRVSTKKGWLVYGTDRDGRVRGVNSENTILSRYERGHHWGGADPAFTQTMPTPWAIIIEQGENAVENRTKIPIPVPLTRREWERTPSPWQYRDLVGRWGALVAQMKPGTNRLGFVFLHPNGDVRATCLRSAHYARQDDSVLTDAARATSDWVRGLGIDDLIGASCVVFPAVGTALAAGRASQKGESVGDAALKCATRPLTWPTEVGVGILDAVGALDPIAEALGGPIEKALGVFDETPDYVKKLIAAGLGCVVARVAGGGLIQAATNADAMDIARRLIKLGASPIAEWALRKVDPHVKDLSKFVAPPVGHVLIPRAWKADGGIRSQTKSLMVEIILRTASGEIEDVIALINAALSAPSLGLSNIGTAAVKFGTEVGVRTVIKEVVGQIMNTEKLKKLKKGLDSIGADKYLVDAAVAAILG